MNILLADPDRDILLCCSRLLEQEGYTVATAFDAAELFRLWDETRPDLVILDTNLPQLNPDKWKQRAAGERTPLLVLGTRRSLPAGPGQAAFSYLAFPFMPDEFLERTAGLLQAEQRSEVTSYE